VSPVRELLATRPISAVDVTAIIETLTITLVMLSKFTQAV
jgi:hypothetical protein